MGHSAQRVVLLLVFNYLFIFLILLNFYSTKILLWYLDSVEEGRCKSKHSLDRKKIKRDTKRKACKHSAKGWAEATPPKKKQKNKKTEKQKTLSGISTARKRIAPWKGKA